MSPNLSSAHFPRNKLMYEQVVFSMFSLVGIARSGIAGYTQRSVLGKLILLTILLPHVTNYMHIKLYNVCLISFLSILLSFHASTLVEMFMCSLSPLRGGCICIYRRSVPESRHPSNSDIDIIVDCFSVNHGLPAFLFNVLHFLLIYLF